MMRGIFILFIITLPILSFAHEKIEQLIKENPRLNIAIQVKDLKTGQEIYSHNPYQRMLPASVTKSFTAYAALEYLKPDFTYNTKILRNNNDIYFKFSGDPSLTKDNLRDLLTRAKLKEVVGKVIIDDMIFDQTYKAEGWSWDDSKFCYAAPSSAIVVDGNCFQMNLTADGITTKSNNFAQINNQIISKHNSVCSPNLIANSDNSYELTGCLDPKAGVIPLNIAYQNPRLMIISLIKSLFNEQKIEFTAEIIFETTPITSEVLAEHRSEPLNQLIKQMQKDSNNVFADNLLKTIGALYYNTMGNFANGTKAVAEILTLKTNIDTKEIKIVDGSGGSRYNLIAPDHLVDLFAQAYHNKNFYDTLPEPKRFLEHPELSGVIRGKTGGMSGVFTLAGYINHDKVFAIMINGNMGSREKLTKLMEQILVILVGIAK